MKILNISSVLRAPLQRKIRENDILFVFENQHKKYYPESEHIYVLVIPYSNFILALFSQKYREYYDLRRKGKYFIEGREVYVIAVPMFKGDQFIKPLLNWFGYLQSRSSLSYLVEKYSPSVIHAHNVQVDAYIAKALADDINIPYIVTTRGIQIHKSRHVLNNLSKAKQLIAINYTYGKIVESLTGKGTEVIPHGIEEVFFNFERKGTVGEELKLVSICRLLKLKNIDKVLSALANVPFDFIYHIYGDGPEEARLRGSISQLGLSDKVKLKGYVDYDEVPRILSNFDVFVMPSLPETLGRVFFEAMAVGLPVIGAKNSGIDGYITPNKEGFLVDPENVGAIRDSIVALNDYTLRNEMGRHARIFAKEFDWKQIVDKYEDIYEKVSLRNN